MKWNKGERRENEWEISERETEHERLLTLGNEQGVVERKVGGGWGDWVTGTEGAVSYTHLTLPTTRLRCRSRWSPYH